MGKVLQLPELLEVRTGYRERNLRVVFTNGCFDILHLGHVEYLNAARSLGDVLIVGINSDESVRRIKGERRPIVPEEDRAGLVAALGCVDFATLFPEDTPYRLISQLIPDVLIKGADWSIENVVGRDVVEANGGMVMTVPLVEGRSTTSIIDTILSRYR